MVKHYRGDDSDLKLLMAGVAEAFGGVSVDDYADSAADFFAEARHPTLDRPYRECAFLPMVELLRYLEANGFATYIASGGDRDFMRDDRAGPLRHPARARDRLELRARATRTAGSSTRRASTSSTTGRRSRCASGAGSGGGPRSAAATRTATSRCSTSRPACGCSSLHDDAEREFDYTAGAEDALARGYTTISVKDDWATVFA